MKTFLLRSFLLLVFMLCCQKNNAMPVQTAVWRINYNTNRSTDSYGHTNKDVRFKFEVTSSNVVFTHAGSKLTDTSMYLLQCLPNGEVDELSCSHSNMGMEITQGALKNTELGNLIEEDLKQMTPKQASMRVLSLESVCELVSEGTGDTGLNNGDIRLNVYAVISNRDTIKVGKIDREMTFIHSIKKESSSKIHRYFKLEVTHPVIVDIAMETQWDTQVELSISSTKGGNIEGNITGPFHNLLLSPGIYHVLENYRATASTQVALVIHAVPVEEEPERPVEMSPYTPNASHSYITSIVPVMAQTTPDSLRYPGKAIHSINYYDGLGRPEQIVQYGASPDGKKDCVSRTAYDRLGREHQQWLPSFVSRSFGYTSTNSLEGISATQYNDRYAYNRMVYEDSPLERIIEHYGPGEAWQVGGHAVKSAYRFNQAADNCLFFTVDGTRENPVLVRKGFYSPNLLDVTRTTDEDGNRGEVFTDKEGYKVLERRFLSSIATTSASSDTYYVYDDYGNLCYVLPPMINGDISTDNLNKYAYRYRYDYRNRCVEKKLPGAEPVTYMYDFANQLTFSQDNNQKTKHLHTVYQYDLHGRMVMRGEANVAIDVSKHMISCIPVSQVSDTDLYQEFPGTNYASNLYSTIQLLPLTPEFNIINYYDNYDFTRLKGFKDFNYYHFQSDIPRNLLTGRMVANISNSSERNYELHIYNQKSELTGSWLQRFSGYNERINYTYSFTGKPKEKRCVYLTGKFGLLWEKMELKDVYTYEYDSKDRLANVYHKLNDRDSIKLAAYSYDVLGRLAAKTLHNSLTHTFYQNYKYDIHSWLTEINGSHFTQKLGYANTDNPCYNGNISRMEWGTREAEQYFFVLKKYNYIYDGMDRLKSATYSGAMPSLANQYNEEVTKYDKNGNILGLKRNGKTRTGSYGLIDDLTFTLIGNQLTAVNDAATATAYNGASDFKDGAKLAVEYAYDANGNLTKDLNKNITDIKYNCLNLPNRIIFADGSAISYLYSADGTKLRTTHKIGEITTTTDYCGNVILENNRASKLLTEEGYISLNDDKYHYYQKDHQGNIRVVVDQSGNTEEVNNYYPFGGIFESTGNVQTYKYNGKELDTEKGLN